MKTFKLFELGCKVNQYETQLLREKLLSEGLHEANGRPADVYVINTCTVTAAADSDSRSFLRQAMASNPSARIIVTGCYVEKDAASVKNICPDAVILKNNEKPKAGISSFAGHNRAFVKIQDGCDNRCSYCKVPLVRGGAKNRPQSEILDEAGRLAAGGFKEIVLCGICLGAYKDLTGLLNRLETIPELKRIRLSSIEPVYVRDELIEKMADSKKICRHLHMPLQSGDDKILHAMNRNYTSGRYIKLIEYIRSRISEIAVSTDVLVGFPGETDAEFKNTISTLQAVRPMRMHIFTYSKREGTKAFYMPNDVDKKEKSSRAGILRTLARDLSFSYRKRFEGSVVKVLVEDSRDKKTNLLTGYTDTYIRILFDSRQDLSSKLIDVRIKGVSTEATMAEVVHGD